MTLHATLRTLGWLAGTLFPQQAVRALQGRDFNAALGRVDDALAVAEESRESWEPGELPKVGPKSPKWLREMVELAEAWADDAWRAAGLPDFPDCNCAAHQAADLDDHRPACAARAAGSPAVGERTPDNRPTAGRTPDPRVFDRDAYMAGLTWPEPKVPNLKFPDPAEMKDWPDWLLMAHAANSLAWPEHSKLIDTLRTRSQLGERAHRQMRDLLGGAK